MWMQAIINLESKYTPFNQVFKLYTFFFFQKTERNYMVTTMSDMKTSEVIWRPIANHVAAFTHSIPNNVHNGNMLPEHYI